MIYWISGEERRATVADPHDIAWRIAIYRGWMAAAIVGLLTRLVLGTPA